MSQVSRDGACVLDLETAAELLSFDHHFAVVPGLVWRHMTNAT